jgi:hypothetical protein
VLLRSLPPATRCTSMAEVKAFWSQSRESEQPRERESDASAGA